MCLKRSYNYIIGLTVHASVISYLHHTARMFSSDTGSLNFHSTSMFNSDQTPGYPSRNLHFGEYTPSPAPLSSGHMPLPDSGDPFITDPRIPQPMLTPFQRVLSFLMNFSSPGTNKIHYRVHICTIISSSRPCVNTARLWRCKFSKLQLNVIPSRTYHFVNLV
jgi:hypothetical protein